MLHASRPAHISSSLYQQPSSFPLLLLFFICITHTSSCMLRHTHHVTHPTSLAPLTCLQFQPSDLLISCCSSSAPLSLCSSLIRTPKHLFLFCLLMPVTDRLINASRAPFQEPLSSSSPFWRWLDVSWGLGTYYSGGGGWIGGWR